jgi:hypothetical protein
MMSDFCLYMEMCDKSGFRAEGLAVGSRCIPYSHQNPQAPNDFGKRTITGPLLNRWHPQRRIAWLAKMYQLAQWYEANRIEGCTLITLTGYQGNSGLSVYETWDNINASRVKLLKILRKYLGRVDYFWVVEPHTYDETGYPHYHLAVFREIDNHIKDSAGRGMEDKLRDLYSKEWQAGSHTYGLDFKVMKGESSIKDLKNYLMKYISKGYVGGEGWSEGELIFNAHLFGATHGYREPAFGEFPRKDGKYGRVYRLIGMSQNLSKILRPEEVDHEDIIWLKTDETEPTEYRDPESGEWITEERKKPLYFRQLIPDWLDTWRSLAKIQSWNTCVIDEKERLRRARAERHKDTSW